MEEEHLGCTQKTPFPAPESDMDSQPPPSSSIPEKQHISCLLERNVSFAYRVETVYKSLIPWHRKYGDRLSWIFFGGDKCILIPHVLGFHVEKNMVSRIIRSFSTDWKASPHKQHILKSWDHQPRLHKKRGRWVLRGEGEYYVLRISLYFALFSPCILG